ncbi:hypothetical protein ABLE94_02650 [Gordonia sp. VNK1]|uniref:hypothetical protein n=1 Tax=Gordonia oleivorans TaxID=3156618 RepID=UPI0032B54D09
MAKTVQHRRGDDSIDDSTPKEPAKRGDPWVLRWRYWPSDGGPAQAFRTQGKTKAETLRKARAKLAELKASEADDQELNTSRWDLSSPMSAYFDEVVVRAIDTAQLEDGRPLAPGSKRLHRRSLALLRGECGNTEHDHTATTLEQFKIRGAINFRKAQACIEYIADTHGSETARQCRNVLNRYVYGEMVDDGLIDRSPMSGRVKRVKLGQEKMQVKPENPALTADDYHRVLDHLLTLDPKAATPPSRMQKRLIPVWFERRRTAIDLTLLQMTTGLRFTECRTLEPDEVINNAAGGVSVLIPAGKAKNHKARLVPTLDERVAERIAKRAKGTQAGGYVLGAPADDRKVWDQSNASKALVELYGEIADATGVEALRSKFRSHGWRATLNMIHYHLPASLRSEWFGHSEETNEVSYKRQAVDHSAIVASHRAGRERHLKAVSK